MRKPPKPRITKPRLKWVWNANKSLWEPYHRIRWTEGGKRKEKSVLLVWNGDAKKLDDLYWACESGRHEKQKPPPSKRSWRTLVEAWRTDTRVQRKLAASTKAKYKPVMDRIVEKNGDKAVAKTTRAAVRAAHDSLSATPRKADWYVQIISLLWNYAVKKRDWPLGQNPAAGIDLFGKQREFEPWPPWMVDKLESAPEVVRTAAELILNTGQRPNAAIGMRHKQFSGEWMKVLNEKNGGEYEVYCPAPLRAFLADRPKSGAFVLAKNLTEPMGYDAVERAFRAWRSTLPNDASKYVLHGLRKLAIVRLAEAGCSDAEIQAVTDQSMEMVAYYRKQANRKVLSRSAAERNENKTGKGE